MSLPGTARWVLLALLGLAIAIAVAIAAANLTSQQIGIASESVSAGDALAPALRTPGGDSGPDERPPGETGTGEPTTTTEELPPPEGETTGPDDHVGESGGLDSDGDDD
ncbi:MAG TPA: hypothetical protein VFX35_06595 [Solirubrobacterales bacterium]|nr:hypothetical protein [Solirubrobacterales bacterium]